jgi:glycosyltransferase involved in cell wall biosynthesis
MNNDPIPFITVICPTYNEEKYITSCINSVIKSDYPKERMMILFVDGNSTDNTRIIIKEYHQKYSFIHLLNNPYKIVPYALNLGIKSAIGEIIFRIDAHSIYSKNYFSVLVRNLIELKADNVGAVLKTDTLNKNPLTLAIKEVLNNPWGIGDSYFRIGIKKVKAVDTVPFGCFRKDVFERFGSYDTRLKRNQDIELNKRIIRGGGKIFLIPGTYCTYLVRETITSFILNNFENGKWNVMTVYYTKTFNSLSIRHFIPIIFLLSLITPLLLALINPLFLVITGISLFIYISIMLMTSLSLSVRKKMNLFYLLLVFVSLHISYGIGSIIGIFKVLFTSK